MTIEVGYIVGQLERGVPVATYNLSDAKNQLSALVDRALEGEEVVIARRNLPAVLLVPVAPTRPTRVFGRHQHLGRVTDAFFDPLPEEELEGLG